MKKISLIGAILISISSIAQQTILVNGGQFGNANSNVNVVIYDRINNSYNTIDTIHTQSVQEIILDGAEAFVAAQDSIIKYNLRSASRIASAKFDGPSTKTFALAANTLLVGNWYGKASHNVYYFDATNLNLQDSIADFTQGAKSILVKNGFAYITQNGQTPNFADTLGSILRLDIANRFVTDTLTIANYTGDFGELIENPAGTGFISINSASNTISSFDFATLNGTNTSFPLDLSVSAKSHYSLHNDTLFARFGNGIGSINRNTLDIIDTNIIDTVVTAFTYDTINAEFYVTQTNFFSYRLGKVFDRSGNLIGPFTVGFSPEVIRTLYGITLGVEAVLPEEINFDFYPNPVEDQLFIETETHALMRVFSSKGALVLESRLSEGKQQFDLSELPKGTYLINLQGEGTFGSKLLIKQ